MGKPVFLPALAVLALGFAGTVGFAATELTPENVQKMSIDGLKAQTSSRGVISCRLASALMAEKPVRRNRLP